jgi:hypothetical protein
LQPDEQELMLMDSAPSEFSDKTVVVENVTAFRRRNIMECHKLENEALQKKRAKWSEESDTEFGVGMLEGR